MNVRGWRGVRRDTAAFNGALRVRAKRGMLRSVEPLGGSDAHADRRELRQEELAAILPLSPLLVAFAVLGPDLLAARRQHRSGRRRLC
jgi:hypothetical protein